MLSAASAWGGDWPQYRGPNADGQCPERIRVDWAASGPRLLWRTSLTHGFSSVAVAENRVVTLVKRTVGGEAQEVCIALDASSGRELWARALGSARYDSGASGPAGGSDGPRSTPALRGNRVYVYTAYLVLACLDLADGTVVWSKDLEALYGGRNLTWQCAASPVVVGDFVVVVSGASNQSLMAFRAEDGTLAWKGQSDRMTHATPTLTTLQGVPQIVFYTQTGLVGVAPTNGAVLWRYNFRYSTSSGASPVVADDLVYCSAAYNVGAGAARISRSGTKLTATELWTNGDLMNHWSSAVAREGYLYGLYGYADYKTAPLKCIQASTGEEQWSVDGFGFGGLIRAQEHLVVLTETGTLVLAEARPEAYRETARFKALSGICWNAPAVSQGRLFVRSTKEIAAFDVAPPPPPPLRLATPVAGDDTVRFRLVSTDGQPIDAARAQRIRLYAHTDATSPLAQWTRLMTTPVPEADGSLRLEADVGLEPWRFYIGLEEP